eukprot:m.10919 g.10919  ORF g.10919 m.10919 type:complete len:83 (+) comp6762_c1_seq1:1185-1433(+)
MTVEPHETMTLDEHVALQSKFYSTYADTHNIERTTTDIDDVAFNHQHMPRPFTSQTDASELISWSQNTKDLHWDEDDILQEL